MVVETDLIFGKVFEREAAAQFARHKYGDQAQLVAAGKYGDIDFLVQSAEGVLVGAVEVKARRCTSTEFGSTIVSKRKHDAARFLNYYFQVPTDCVIIFTDKFGVFNLTAAPDGFTDIRRGSRPPVKHAYYDHSRLTYHPDLYAQVHQEIAASVH